MMVQRMRRAARPIATVFFALFAMMFASMALADALDDTLAKFTTDKFPDTQAAIGELIASGAPIAPKLLDALAEGRLLFDADENKLYI